MNEKYFILMVWIRCWLALDVAIIQTAVIEAGGGAQKSSKLSKEEITVSVLEKVNRTQLLKLGLLL